MHTNKQNKIVWQQLQITVTELCKDFSKVYFCVVIFLLFCFDLLK